MRPDPRQGVIPRELRDGVRDAPPPPIVLTDADPNPDPDVKAPSGSLMGDLFKCVLVVVGCLLVTGVCAAVVAGLTALACYSPSFLGGLLFLAVALVVVAALVALIVAVVLAFGDWIKGRNPLLLTALYWVGVVFILGGVAVWVMG